LVVEQTNQGIKRHGVGQAACRHYLVASLRRHQALYW